MAILRIAAFCDGESGGNPAGVVLCTALPPPHEMQKIASDVGYSETVFAEEGNGGWRVRYFAPATEIPFCGHATIALGAALAEAHGSGVFPLHLNNGQIEVEGRCDASGLWARFQSPNTRSAPAPDDLVTAVLHLFSYSVDDLDPRIPPAIIQAGARHLVIALASRDRLAGMAYDMTLGRFLMETYGFATISLINAETPVFFHARNAFAAGGLFEDPATGAAAAALAGYLRDLGWPHEGHIEILQGADMGMPCRLHADFSHVPGEGIAVSGVARQLTADAPPSPAVAL